MDVCELANLIYELLGNGKQGKKKPEKRKNVYICLSVSRNKWWVQAKLLLTLATFCSLRKTNKQTKPTKLFPSFMRYLTWWHSYLTLSLSTLSLYEKGFITCRCSEISDEPISWERERERRLTRERRVFSVYSMYIIPVTNLHVFFFLSAPNLFLVL